MTKIDVTMHLLQVVHLSQQVIYCHTTDVSFKKKESIISLIRIQQHFCWCIHSRLAVSHGITKASIISNFLTL